MAKQAELDISLRRKEEGVYALEFRFRHPDKPVEEHLGQEEPVLARLDPEALSQLTFDPNSYARKLTSDFFADAAGLAFFARARATAGQFPLRIRLAIAADAAELHSVYWETLLDPEKKQPLFTGENVTFSRYIASPDPRPVQLAPKKALKALVAVANPSDLPPEQAIDARAEFVRAIQEMGGIQSDSLGVEADSPPVTLDNLAERLRELQPTILYLVCHGALSKGEPYLILENEQGGKDVVKGEELVTRLNELARPPLLVVLASCQSAGRPGSIEARAALGPRLAAAGVPAVMAMQGDVSQDTVADFMPVFFRQLAKDGRLEYAMSLARGRVRERLDYWMPALFTRLETIYATRVIPWVGYGFAALGVIILALVAGGAWWANRVEPMQGGYNLAVAEFTPVSSGGQAVPKEDVAEISRWFFQVVEEEKSRLPSIMRPETRGPERIGPIQEIEEKERQAAADRLAKKLNATILIYGRVSRLPEGDYLVQPEFLVNSEGYFFGSEITGPSSLGGPIRMQAPLQAGALELNAELKARTQALQRLVGGLGAYSLGDYDEAALRFQQAVNIPDWAPEDGQEVAYFLLGQAYLRGYDRLTGPEERLVQAKKAFEQAYQINPEYARACLGLGAVALQQAGVLDGLQTGIVDADPAILEEARYWYRVSAEKTDSPPGAHAPAKADFGMGQVHLLGMLGGLPGYSEAEARASFERVIGAYQAQPNDDLKWYAAHSQALLGWLAQQNRGDWNSLDLHSRQAITLLEELPQGKTISASLARYWSWVGLAQMNLGNPDRARQAYDNALRIGENAVNPSELEMWKDQRGGIPLTWGGGVRVTA